MAASSSHVFIKSGIIKPAFKAFWEILVNDYPVMEIEEMRDSEGVYQTSMTTNEMLKLLQQLGQKRGMFRSDTTNGYSFLNNIPAKGSILSVDAIGNDLYLWLLENDTTISVLKDLELMDVVRISLEDPKRYWAGVLAIIHLIEKLEHLDLQNCEISYHELRMIVRALEHNRSLLSVNLSHNKIDDIDVMQLKNYLEKTSLTTMNLSHNKIYPPGITNLNWMIRKNPGNLSIELFDLGLILSNSRHEESKYNEPIVSAPSTSVNQGRPGTISGWVTQDLPVDGYNFFHAFVDQIQRAQLPILEQRPEGVDPHIWLRFMVTKMLNRDFADGEWLGDEAIECLVKLFNLTVVIADTRFLEQGFYTSFFLDENREIYQLTAFDESRKLPGDRPIIYLATTSNQYISVHSYPELTEGVIQGSSMNQSVLGASSSISPRDAFFSPANTAVTPGPPDFLSSFEI